MMDVFRDHTWVFHHRGEQLLVRTPTRWDAVAQRCVMESDNPTDVRLVFWEGRFWSKTTAGGQWRRLEDEDYEPYSPPPVWEGVRYPPDREGPYQNAVEAGEVKILWTENEASVFTID